MGFPISIRRTLKLSNDKSLTQREVMNALLQHIDTSNQLEERDKNTISYTSRHSLINFKYSVRINSEVTSIIKLTYQFNLVELLRITLGLIIFSALFSRFSINSFLIFSLIFTLIFYFSNIIFIDNSIRRIITKALIGVSKEELLTEEQEEWMANPQKCPGCGSFITEFDAVCQECGLMLGKGKKRKPFDYTQSEGSSINYHYKEGK